MLTFLAIIAFVGTCRHLLTVPPFPHPNSFITSKSSLLRSNLNSTPISRVASCSLSLLWYELLDDVPELDSDGVVGSSGEARSEADEGWSECRWVRDEPETC